MTDPATVLVVDDEQDIVTLMRDFLEAAGYRVLTAPDGQAALAATAPLDLEPDRFVNMMWVWLRTQMQDTDWQAFMAALEPAGKWTSWGDVTDRLGMPPKVVLAKARTLIERRGTLHGCPCGCRGDFHRAHQCRTCQ